MKSCLKKCLCLIVLGPLVTLTQQLSAAETLEGVSIQGYEALSVARVGRFTFEYTYGVTVANSGPETTNVVGTVVSSNPGAIVSDGIANFDVLPSGESSASTDTISIRINRRSGFNSGQLSWSFEGDLAETPLSTLTGRITAVDGTPVPGVMIDASADGLDTVIALTDSQGRFSTELPAETAFTLNASAPGFATGVARLVSSDSGGVLDVSLVLSPIEFVRDDVENSLVETPLGVVIAVEAQDFDVPPGETLDVAIATVDVSDQAQLLAFPGAFEGVQNNVLTPIASFGTSEITFSSNGAHVPVKEGETVEIQLPIFIPTLPDGTVIQLGMEIPVWSLNEETGVWLAEAIGVVVESANSPTGLALLAQVSHFSWWNADIALETGRVDIGIGGSKPGRATVSATTTAQIAWGGPSTSTTIPVGGSLEGLVVPAGAETCISVQFSFDDGTSVTTLPQCVNPAAGQTVALEFVDPQLGDELLISSSRTVINSRIGRLAPRVALNALTIESSVDYAGSNLPTGLTLLASGDTTAELTGRFGEVGTFTTTVTGTDSEGNEDSLEVTYNVADLPIAGGGPDFGDVIEVIGTTQNDRFYDLNEFNDGDPVVSWSITGTGPFGGMSTVDDDGILSVASFGTLYFEAFDGLVYIGTLTATSANGESQTVDILFTPDFLIGGCESEFDFGCEFDLTAF